MIYEGVSAIGLQTGLIPRLVYRRIRRLTIGLRPDVCLLVYRKKNAIRLLVYCRILAEWPTTRLYRLANGLLPHSPLANWSTAGLLVCRLVYARSLTYWSSAGFFRFTMTAY